MALIRKEFINDVLADIMTCLIPQFRKKENLIQEVDNKIIR